VDVARIDNLIRATGELVLNRNRLLDFIQQSGDSLSGADMMEKLSEISAQLNLMVSDLQQEARATRMQPIGRVFAKYPRVIRDLSRDLGKEIDLFISGETTELDNAIIEDIGDPLIHLVRNCCDHGIELPDVREAMGKPRRGRVELKARHEGNSIIIEISDDGKGMSPEALKKAAIAKKVITESRAAAMSDAEALNLIFAPGFSTAEKVTAVSGRGVGMDVVKTTISKLNGIIDIESVIDKGSIIRIKLPLTMAITVALEIETGNERYLVPQESVVEIMRVPRSAYETVIDEGEFLFRGRFRCPLLDLKKLLNIRTCADEISDHGYILVFGRAEERTGILVDNVIQQHEIAVKPAGDFLNAFPIDEISGAAIMGDGNVELILNAGHFIRAGNSAKAVKT
jgi:two-component system chemotaxis sensor kinase CheA